MTTIYKVFGGGAIAAQSNQEVVAKLRATSMNPGESETEFMEQMSSAAKTWNGSIISTYNYDEFVADLIENKLLVAINN